MEQCERGLLFEVQTPHHWAHAAQECYIRLLVRNSSTLFAYWQIDSSYKYLVCECFHCTWESLSAWISVHDVTDLDYDGYRDNGAIVVPVEKNEYKTYIQPVRGGREYIADFRLQTHSGHPFVLMRSMRVQTPPGNVGSFPKWPVTQAAIQKQPSPSSSKRPYPEAFDGYGSISSQYDGRDAGR